MKINSKLLVYWCAGTNFGDELNRYIWSDFFHKEEVLLTAFKNAQIVGCGSILEDLIVEEDKKKDVLRFKMLPELKILSTGMDFHKDIDYSKKYSFRRKTRIYALRGKKTAEMISKLTGERLNFDEIVLADGGLLANMLVSKENRNTSREFELGIVPHYMEKGDLRFYKLAELVPNSVILDVDEDPIVFVNKMVKCKRIASSALHPLIAADALHIPNIWIRASQKVTSIEKYEDYYSAFDIKKDYISIDKISDSWIKRGGFNNSIQVPMEKVNHKQSQLMEVLEKVHEEIRRDENSLGWRIHCTLLEIHNLYRKLKI